MRIDYAISYQPSAISLQLSGGKIPAMDLLIAVLLRFFGERYHVFSDALLAGHRTETGASAITGACSGEAYK